MAEPTVTLKSNASFRAIIPYEANMGGDKGCVDAGIEGVGLDSFLVFRSLADGMVEIETRNDTFFLATDNTLWVQAASSEQCELTFKPLTFLPRYSVDNGFMPEPIPLNQVIARCWYGPFGRSHSLLEESQKVIVDRFFQAVENMFPAEFVGE